MRLVCRVVASVAVPAILIGCASTGTAASTASTGSTGSGIGAPRPQLLGVVVVSAAPGPTRVPDSGRASCVTGTGAAVAGTVRASSTERNALFEPRWRDDASGAVRVHIDQAGGIDGSAASGRREVLSAITAWEVAGAPVNFVVVKNDEPAAVRVHWIEKFDSRYEGWTTVSWDQDGWLIGADVELARRSPSGALLSARERQQVVTHEFGHVLGLSHSGSTASIMSPVVKVAAITPVDASALQALYSGQSRAARVDTDPATCAAAGT